MEDINNMKSACDTYQLARDIEKAQRHNAVINNYQTPRNKSKLQEYLSRPNVKEYNSIVIDKTFKQMNKPLKYSKGYQECQEEINDYMQTCVRYEMIPTISSLCLWLGIGKTKLYEQANDKQTYEYANLLQGAIDVCRFCNETGAIDGSISPQVFSLLASNYYGLNTSQQVEIKPVIDNQVNNANTMKIIQEQIALENKDKS